MAVLRLVCSLIAAPQRSARRALALPSAARGWWRDQNRYEEIVPEDIRRLAEEHGIPKPNVWIPSAQGRTVRVRRGRP